MTESYESFAEWVAYTMSVFQHAENFKEKVCTRTANKERLELLN